MHDLEEELPAHPKTAAKHVLSMEWLVGKVVGVQHAVALYPLSRLALSATWRRTTALRLRHLHVQLGERCEDLQVLFTFWRPRRSPPAGVHRVSPHRRSPWRVSRPRRSQWRASRRRRSPWPNMAKC